MYIHLGIYIYMYILKNQLCSHFTQAIYYRADFWEFLTKVMPMKFSKVYSLLCRMTTDLIFENFYNWRRSWNAAMARSYCNALQHTATHCNTLQHTATHCNALQHTETHCSTLQHSCDALETLLWPDNTATRCSTLQHTANHCNTLQHICDTRETLVWPDNTATYSNTL